MKARLLTINILSALKTILFIVFIVLMVKLISGVISDIDQTNTNYWERDYSTHTYSHNTIWDAVLKYMVIFAFIMTIGFAEFVMGIIILAMEKDEEVRGLMVATGVLSILPFMSIPTFIVSLIALIKLRA